MKFKHLIIICMVLMFSTTLAFADTSTSSSSASSVNGDQVTQQAQGLENMNILDNVGGIKESFNSEGKRGFVIPGEVRYGHMINSYSKPLPSEGFQRVEELIMYSCWFTEGSLESLLKGVEDVDAEFKIANERIIDAKLAAEDETTKWIKVIISKDKYVGSGKVGFKGYVTARSEHRNTTMTEVMAKAALISLENGCNVIHFTAQGAVRDTEASGWGIGFNTTQAQIYSGQDKSNVSSGGMGYSRATAGTRDKPWLQGFGLVDNDLEYPALNLPVTITENKITVNEKPAGTEGNQIAANITPQTGNHTVYGTLVQ